MYETLIKELEKSKVKLVAVSKTKPAEAILELYNKGQRVFGENRVQECVKKYEQLPKDIEWHIIGHLQKNKVKHIAPFISMIHSVDSIELLTKINNEAIKNDRTIDCLLQMKIAVEESKFGLDSASLLHMIQSDAIQQLKNIRILGLMGMGSFVSDESISQREFQVLKNQFDRIKKMKILHDSFEILSMGMSGDYKLAIAQGSNMVRIGSLLFGSR